MSLFNLLSNQSYWIVNKPIAKHLKCIQSAALLSELVDRFQYYENKNLLREFEEELFFYATAEHLEQNTTLSYKVQKRCIKTLTEAGFIKTKLFGVPAKLHFCIDENAVYNVLISNRVAQTAKLEFTPQSPQTSQIDPKGKTRIDLSAKLDEPKGQNYISDNNKLTNKELTNKEKLKKEILKSFETVHNLKTNFIYKNRPEDLNKISELIELCFANTTINQNDYKKELSALFNIIYERVQPAALQMISPAWIVENFTEVIQLTRTAKPKKDPAEDLRELFKEEEFLESAALRSGMDPDRVKVEAAEFVENRIFEGLEGTTTRELKRHFLNLIKSKLKHENTGNDKNSSGKQSRTAANEAQLIAEIQESERKFLLNRESDPGALSKAEQFNGNNEPLY